MCIHVSYASEILQEKRFERIIDLCAFFVLSFLHFFSFLFLHHHHSPFGLFLCRYFFFFFCFGCFFSCLDDDNERSTHHHHHAKCVKYCIEHATAPKIISTTTTRMNDKENKLLQFFIIIQVSSNVFVLIIAFYGRF